MAAKKSFLLRIDPAMYDAMERWAADELRRVNAHMEYVLREALRKEGRLPRKEGQSEANRSGSPNRLSGE